MKRLLTIVTLLSLCGCGSQRMSPHLGFGNLNIEAQLDREDVVILGTVEGESKTVSILLGLIQIIDDDKLRLFGIKFFKDKYVWGTLNPTASRAYYKALAAHPDADAVFQKSWEREESGTRLLYFEETVLFRGKAIALKSDGGSTQLPQVRQPAFADALPTPWNRMREGMTTAHVAELLGEPTDRSDGRNSVIWYYCPNARGAYVAFSDDRVVSWRT